MSDDLDTRAKDIARRLMLPHGHADRLGLNLFSDWLVVSQVLRRSAQVGLLVGVRRRVGLCALLGLLDYFRRCL